MSGSLGEAVRPSQGAVVSPRRAGLESKDARSLALRALLSLWSGRKFAQEYLDELLRRIPLSPPDKALLNELVYGVIRHRATLDAIIDTFAKARRVEPAVRETLRIGVYQLVLLDRIPESAAVNTSVELAKCVSRGGHGFVNAVLRAVARDIQAKGLEALPAHQARHAIRAKSGRWCLFRQPVLPDPTRDPLGHLAASLSHPNWLVERWVGRLGQEGAARLCEANNAVRPVFLRVNRLKTDRAQLLSILRAAGIAAHEAAHDSAIALEDTRPVTELPGFADGLFQVQDLTSMRVVDLLDTGSAKRVLDLCAAPGGKATHIAEAMGRSGLVIAVDQSAKRLRRVSDNCQRLGICNTRLVCADARNLPLRAGGGFDRVLVDAPCSNSGVLSRRPEARWRLTPADLAELAALQYGLLTSGVTALRPGGLAVYSTCSIELEENEQVVARLLAGCPKLELKREERFLPHQGEGDGGYAAVLMRT